MASDASHMLEAALEQMDDIIAGKSDELSLPTTSNTFSHSLLWFFDSPLKRSVYFHTALMSIWNIKQT